MAATPVQPENRVAAASRLPGRRYDHLFFTSMSVVMLVTVLVGFARTYFLAGVFRAPLPSTLLHLHGAAFTAWMLLLLSQSTLVAADRVDIHRRLGIAGFLLGCLMVVLGVLVATEALARNANDPVRDAQAFYIVPLSNIAVFGALLYCAYWARRRAAAHKRMIYLTTTALLTAATARMSIIFFHGTLQTGVILADLFIVILFVYDLWSTRKVHPATLWAGTASILVDWVRTPVAHTNAWHSFAAWAQHLGTRI